MRRPSAVIVVAIALGGCGGGGGNGPDGAAGAGGKAGAPGAAGAAGQAGSAADAAGQAGSAADAAAGAGADDAGDAADAPAAFSCAGAGGGACNDNPAVSSIWGTCGADGRCHCNAGFEINAATGKCRPAGAPDAGSDAAEAGDAPAAPLPAWRSGTRLRARLLRASGTADAIFQSAFDKDLGVGCAFVKARDGSTRCMPSSIVPYYGDDACTMPVAPVPAGCAPAAYVSRVDACQASGFKLGAKVTPAKLHAFDPSGTCVEIPDTGTQDFYVLTAVVDAGFVAATERRDARGGGLAMRYWASDDGGLFPIGAWDVARGASCVEGAGAYADRCVPAVVAKESRSVPAFSENTCKVAVGYTESVTCGAEPASAVGVLETTACGVGLSYAAATRYTGALFRSQGPTCFPWASPPASYAFYAEGAAIAPSALPVMTRAFEGVGRLQVRRYDTAVAQAIDSQPAFYDTVRKATCLREDTAAGPVCMSSRAVGVSFYGDGECTKPVWVESKTKPDPACAGPGVDVLYRQTGAASCGALPRLELFEVGAPATNVPILYSWDGTTCTDSGFSPAENDVFTTAPATAPALEVVTE